MNDAQPPTTELAQAAAQQRPPAEQSQTRVALTPTTIKEAIEFAELLSKSSLIPKEFVGNPGNIIVAIQWGAELGLAPMQAMQSIAVINGRPSIWGDTPLALVRASGLLDAIQEDIRDDGATCTVKRRGAVPISRTFTVDDAKLAGLWGKRGREGGPTPWVTYPKRMLQLRARAFALRDEFTDVLRGMPIGEEMVGHEIDITPQTLGGAVQLPPSTPKMYPAADFEANLPAWRDVIASGRKTAEEVIATVQSKGALTDDQKALIRGRPAPAA
jgi:hypothetical protein